LRDNWTGWRGHGSWADRRRTARVRLSLLALENGLERVPGLGNMGEIERRLCINLRLAGTAAGAPVLEIVLYLLGLVGLDGAGVGLGFGDTNRRQSVQDGPALDLKLACQIVDSNFAHPSLFVPLRP
jgi:hypothetical protein